MSATIVVPASFDGTRPQGGLVVTLDGVAVFTKDVLADHVQLVLTDRTTLSENREFGVFSPKTWRLADLGAKHAFLRSGLGWGGMPLHLVAADLATGALVRLAIVDDTNTPLAHAPPGPAGRWLVDLLRRGATDELESVDIV